MYIMNLFIKFIYILLEYHKLVVSVQDGHRLPSKHLNHPYCELALGNVKVGRTDVGEGSNPFWHTEFFLE